MTIFVYAHYAHAGRHTPPGKDDLPFAFDTGDAPVRYFSDENDGQRDEWVQRPQFRVLIGEITGKDTLIVNRLDDLGTDAREIGATISLVLKRGVRLFVRQIGDVDLGTEYGRLILNTVDAFAALERQHLRQQLQRPAESAPRSGRRTAEVPGRMRTAIVTDYSLGESISSLARRYKLPRTAIMKMVRPALPDDSSFPLAFGD
ncbi:hypothetical protein GCM10027343_11980 [Noviherbaspirillum agri]